MIPFGFEEEQRNPDLAQFTDLEAEPPAKRVKKKAEQLEQLIQWS